MYLPMIIILTILVITTIITMITLLTRKKVDSYGKPINTTAHKVALSLLILAIMVALFKNYYDNKGIKQRLNQNNEEMSKIRRRFSSKTEYEKYYGV